MSHRQRQVQRRKGVACDFGPGSKYLNHCSHLNGRPFTQMCMRDMFHYPAELPTTGCCVSHFGAPLSAGRREHRVGLLDYNPIYTTHFVTHYWEWIPLNTVGLTSQSTSIELCFKYITRVSSFYGSHYPAFTFLAHADFEQTVSRIWIFLPPPFLFWFNVGRRCSPVVELSY